MRTIGDLGEFLTDRTVSLAREFPAGRAEAEDAFRTTFDYLADSLGEHSFHRYDTVRERFIGGFLVSAYEVVALGIGYNFQKYRAGANLDVARGVAKDLWKNSEFQSGTGSGLRASTRIPVTIPLGRRLFA